VFRCYKLTARSRISCPVHLSAGAVTFRSFSRLAGCARKSRLSGSQSYWQSRIDFSSNFLHACRDPSFIDFLCKETPEVPMGRSIQPVTRSNCLRVYQSQENQSWSPKQIALFFSQNSRRNFFNPPDLTPHRLFSSSHVASAIGLRTTNAAAARS
jgi:hypothetical protein